MLKLSKWLERDWKAVTTSTKKIIHKQRKFLKCVNLQRTSEEREKDDRGNTQRAARGGVKQGGGGRKTTKRASSYSPRLCSSMAGPQGITAACGLLLALLLLSGHQGSCFSVGPEPQRIIGMGRSGSTSSSMTHTVNQNNMGLGSHHDMSSRSNNRHLTLYGIEVPVYKFRGEDAQLECQYNGGTDPLYSVKWYKDDREFYRYLFKKPKPKTTFTTPGVNVNGIAYFDINGGSQFPRPESPSTDVHTGFVGCVGSPVKETLTVQWEECQFHSDIEVLRGLLLRRASCKRNLPS
ncbi:uncharacterized protein LOC121870485 [Homarus americanus]|uniref:uncharacterized protein LOC121870485 n=1 Tax=Homarus americanus TaxID=6706 RepID=UPI001C490DF4|nr:uncharacterized protein LOC121870485 [Homarus americanus]